ncbi:MAG: DUF4199 family protein [Alphaproteobacteria bacterium]|nr:DUF4199 family protein [Alphaproteobacteria bacterium]
MINITFLYGTIAGLIVMAGMFLGIFVLPEHGGASEWFGYLTMILALSMIFFGVKRYRDTQGGGVIKFLPALTLGLGIAIVAGIIYVMVWEVYLAATHYSFISQYTDAMVAAQKAKGVTGAALDAYAAEMEKLKSDYANPLFRLPMTFMEIFPVGLVIALISAIILRNSRVLPANA